MKKALFVPERHNPIRIEMYRSGYHALMDELRSRSYQVDLADLDSLSKGYDLIMIPWNEDFSNTRGSPDLLVRGFSRAADYKSQHPKTTTIVYGWSFSRGPEDPKFNVLRNALRQNPPDLFLQVDLSQPDKLRGQFILSLDQLLEKRK